MAKPTEGYQWVEVETYRDGGKVRARPLPGGSFPTSLDVECSKQMRRDHPPGTRFRIWAKLTDREGGGEFLYTSWRWDYEVLSG